MTADTQKGSDTQIRHYVNEIEREYRRGELYRWKVAELVDTAYAEAGKWADGLTAALCEALVLGPDQVRNYGHAWDLRQRCVHLETEYIRVLTVGHFWRMYHIQKRLNMTDSDCEEWLGFAAEERMYVGQMAEKVEMAFDGDPAETWRRRTNRIVRSLQLWYDMSEYNGVPDSVRKVVKKALEVLDGSS